MFKKMSGLTCLILLTLTSSLMAQRPARTPPTSPRPAAVFKIEEWPKGSLNTRGNFVDAIKVSAKDADGKGVAKVTIQGIVREGDAQLYTTADPPAQNLMIETGADGMATFSLITNAATRNVIHFIPFVDGKPVVDRIQVVTLRGRSTVARSRTPASPPAPAPPPAPVASPAPVAAPPPPAPLPAPVPAPSPAPAEDDTGQEASEATDAADQPTVTVEVPTQALEAGRNYPAAIKITVKDKNDAPVKDVLIKGVVQKSDAQIFTDQVPADRAELSTDDKGVVTFSLVTNKDTDPVVVQFTPFIDDVALHERIQVVTLSGTPAFITSLGSKRSYLQFFMGQTFTNDYVAIEGNTRGENRSIGFGNAGPILRLTFDTMWRRQKLPRSAPMGGAGRTTTEIETTTKKSVTAPDGTIQNTITTGKTISHTPPDDNRQHSLRHGLWHTDANIEFSRFPFSPEEGEENKKGLDDAFSGTLGLTWQPNRFASYDKRRALDLIKGDEQPFDAYRFGFFGKVGVTTRSTSEPGGNNSVNRIQFGVRFTHSRSNNSNPVDEDHNEIPIRFVEASYGRFSEWAREDSANRLVIDGGLRITALSNVIFPVYVGAHLNTGPGKDDLRVFVGVLMKLDLLGRLVQGLTGQPE